MSTLVSIITPVYNSASFVEETLHSVLEQKYQNWEMILVDDKSTDNSIEVIKNIIEKDNRFVLIAKDINEGVALARNEGIKRAKGKYIAFLDSDDLWDNNFLALRIPKMESNNHDLSYSSYRTINEAGQVNGKFIIPRTKTSFKDLLKTNYMGCLTVIYNQENLGKQYMENIKTRQDWILWLNILKKGNFAYGEIEILASYRIRKNSLSSNKLKMIKNQWLVYHKYMKLSFLSSFYYLIHWMYYGFKKYK